MKVGGVRRREGGGRVWEEREEKEKLYQQILFLIRNYPSTVNFEL